MSWKDKLAEANKLYEDAKAVFLNPEASEEDKTNAGKMVEDANKLKADGLQLKDILEAAEESKEALEGLRPDNTHRTPKTPENKGTPSSDGPPEFKDWGEYLYAIWSKMAHGVRDDRLKWFKDEEPEGPSGEKQMSGGTLATGGALIPVQFLPELQAVQAVDSIVRKYATVIRMTRRQVAIPVLDQTGTTADRPHWFGGMRFYWTDEAEEKEDTEPKFRKINLVAKKLTGLTYASDELLDDSAISLADFLSGPLGFAGGIAWMEDYAFLRGVGGGQPRGAINAPCTLAPARAAAGAIGYVDCINMLQQFLPSARGRWVVSQSAMASLIQMNGPAGNPSYVWQPNARDGVPGYLFGMPVHWCEKSMALGNRGDILLADFRYYVIGDRQATTIQASEYPRWIYDQTTWRAVHRVDGQPWLSAPLTYQDGATQVSPFVVLSGPTS